MSCVECGGPVPRRARFCPRCGASVGRSAGTATDADGREGGARTSHRTRVATVVAALVGLAAVLVVARLMTVDTEADGTTPPETGAAPGPTVAVETGECADDRRGCVAWRLTVDGGGVVTGTSLVDGTGYAGVDLRRDGGGVVAFSVATGEVRWTRRTNRPVQLVPAADPETVVVVEEPPIGENSPVQALEATTGERRWRSRAPFRVMVAPTIADGRLLIAGYPPAGVAMDLHDPTRSTPLPVDGAVRGPLVGHDGMAYVPLAERLEAVDLRGDDRGWQVPGSAAPGDRVAHGHLVAVDGDGSVVAYEAATGEEAWRADLEAALVPPLVRDARVIVAGDAELTALDPATGQVRYRRPVSLPVPLQVGSHRDTVYHLSGTALTAVPMGAGPQAPPVWSHTFAGDGPRHLPAIAVGGARLVLSTRSELIAFVP